MTKAEDKESAPHKRYYSLFPKSLSASVEQVVKPVYKKHGFAEQRILTQWHEIVGAKLADYSIPQKLVLPKDKTQGGTLHVVVASGRALELQHMQPVILDKIATYFGYSAVTKLKFTQSTTAFARKDKKGAPSEEKSPSKALKAMVAECKDEELRKALLSLGSVIATVEN